jgi:hypothetical protein
MTIIVYFVIYICFHLFDSIKGFLVRLFWLFPRKRFETNETNHVHFYEQLLVVTEFDCI